jgi:hypothetical protein
MRHSSGIFVVLLLAATAGTASSQSSYGRPGKVWWDGGQGGVFPWEEDYGNPDGQVSVVNKNGAVNAKGHPFFEPLGPNGRACVTCHQPSNAMSVSAETVRQRWTETHGKDAIFAAIDGSNCPGLPQAKMSSHSLLLERGLFRIEMPLPAERDFHIEVLRDPTGCNTDPGRALSVYRRPRVAANLGSAPFMADAREATLESQAAAAIRIHEQAGALATPEQLRKIVEFEKQVSVAQSADIRGGLLKGVRGQVRDLWQASLTANDSGLQREFRASVGRGAESFFKRTFAGQTCASCHDGGAARWMDIGTANVRHPEEASRELPLFRVVCDSGRVIYSQDPGRALVSGKCADVGAIAVQQLKGLAARAPYFANGSARTLRELVEFYDRRYEIGYSEAEKRDLVNFLGVL